jgi:hypothetical protein
MNKINESINQAKSISDVSEVPSAFTNHDPACSRPKMIAENEDVMLWMSNTNQYQAHN